MKKDNRFYLAQFILIAGIAYSCQNQAIKSNATSTSNLPPTSNLMSPSTSIAYTEPKIYPFNDKKFTHLAWFYKPPDADQIIPLIQNFDFFILTHKDEETRDQLQFNGVSSPIFQYLLLAEIRQPDTCEGKNYGNQVAYENGDFCLIRDQHPDWFLLDKYGNPINSDSIYYMDPGNTEFRKFWLQRANEMQLQYKWDGLFIDNVEASLAKFEKFGSIPEKYPDDLTYQSAVNGFLKYIQEKNASINENPIFGNIVSVRDDKVWMEYIENLDGAMIESFAVDWSSGYHSASEWEHEMEIIEKALAKNKTLILVSQGQKDDISREQFAFASYLLVSNGNAAFRYTDSGYYNDIWLYENLLIDPGLPLGERYREGSAWRRDFTNGYVLVDLRTNKSNLEFTH